MSADEALRALFETVQADCPPAVWSRGVTLSRSASALVTQATEDEIVVKVATRTGVVAPTVTLWPADDDYLCDCSGREDVCEHVVAALLAVKHGPVATVGYRLERAGQGLRLRRVIVSSDGEKPLEGTVAAAAIAPGVKLVVSPVDVEAERALGYRLPDWIPPGAMPGLLRALGALSDVRFDGRPVTLSHVKVGALAVVEDAPGGGFLLRVIQDPAITELFNSGAALCGDVLHLVGEVGLSGRELEALRGGRVYRDGEVATLVTEVLPSLRSRLRIDVRTRRLPETTLERPRTAIEAQRDGHELLVLATLVYGDPAIARVDGSRLTLLGARVPVRDVEEEGRLARRLEQDLGLSVGHRVRFSGEAAVAFASRLARWRGDVRGTDLAAFHVVAPLVASVRLDDGTFEAVFESEGRTAGAGGVLRAWRAGASMCPLDDGGWAPLPLDWLARYGAIVADLVAAKDDSGTLPASAMPDLLRLCDALDLPRPAEAERLRALVDGFDALPPLALPADLRASLRHYQEDGVRWLSFLRDAGLGAMLADDMGLGKTLQALCALRGRTLVVAPTSVVFNWAAELARFRPGLSVSTYHGPRRALDPAADVTLTTYALLRLDADKLSAEAWDTVVLDEAQAIKNAGSQVARAAFGLGLKLKHGSFRMTLTGTPVENRLDELWSQLRFLNPGLFGGREDFQERYARPIEAGEPGAAERLRARIRPFVLRRKKRDVAPELPPRTDVVLRCELSDAERDVYEAVHAATRDDVLDRLGRGGNVLEALEALLRLRQAACHPALLPGGKAETAPQTSAKVDLLLETLDEVLSEGHKALVFSQWTIFLDLVEPHLTQAGHRFTRLDGSTRDRAGVVAAFQDEAGPPVLLLSLKAGGTGLNLTAADHVFLLDPWWNPAVEDQAADRAHRIGQNRPVLVHRLVAADTVEERILALQEQKRAMADAALGEADRAAALTRDDLMMLLG